VLRKFPVASPLHKEGLKVGQKSAGLFVRSFLLVQRTHFSQHVRDLIVENYTTEQHFWQKEDGFTA
jgi:hypothetical protein